MSKKESIRKFNVFNEATNLNRVTVSYKEVHSQRTIINTPEDISTHQKVLLNRRIPNNNEDRSLSLTSSVSFAHEPELSGNDLRNSVYNGDIFSNITPLSTESSSLSGLEMSRHNAIKCGILLEKFKVDDSFNLEFLCGKFYTLEEGLEKIKKMGTIG